MLKAVSGVFLAQNQNVDQIISDNFASKVKNNAASWDILRLRLFLFSAPFSVFPVNVPALGAWVDLDRLLGAPGTAFGFNCLILLRSCCWKISYTICIVGLLAALPVTGSAENLCLRPREVQILYSPVQTRSN